MNNTKTNEECGNLTVEEFISNAKTVFEEKYCLEKKISESKEIAIEFARYVLIDRSIPGNGNRDGEELFHEFIEEKYGK